MQILPGTETASKTAPQVPFCRKAKQYMQETLLTICAPAPKGYDDTINPFLRAGEEVRTSARALTARLNKARGAMA